MKVAMWTLQEHRAETITWRKNIKCFQLSLEIRMWVCTFEIKIKNTVGYFKRHWKIYSYDLQRTRKCTGNPAHLSSLKRRPTKILHLSGGRQAASKGTVLNTRLSCKKKEKLLLNKIKKDFYELLMFLFSIKFCWLQTEKKN